jgi:hypothetical protein
MDLEIILLRNEVANLQVMLQTLKTAHQRELSLLQTRLEEDGKYAKNTHELALERQQNTHRHEVNRLQLKVTELTSDIAKLQESLFRQRQTNYELNQKVAVEVDYKGGINEKERRRLEEQVESVEHEARKRTGELTETRGNLERLLGDFKKKDEEVKQLQVDATQLTSQQKDLEAGRLRGKVQELEGRLGKVEENTTELEFAQARLRVLEVENERLLQEGYNGSPRIGRSSRVNWPHGLMSVGASGASFMQQDQDRLREENEHLRVSSQQSIVSKLTEDMQAVRNLAATQEQPEVKRLKERISLMEAEAAGLEKTNQIDKGELARLQNE